MKAFDMHCDTLLGGNRNHLDLVNDQMHISLDKLGAFEHYVQCFAIFIRISSVDRMRSIFTTERLHITKRRPKSTRTEWSGRITAGNWLKRKNRLPAS